MKFSVIQLFMSMVISSALAAPVIEASKALSGSLRIHDLYISNPFQADPESSYNATLDMVVTDDSLPNRAPVHCHIEWKAGVAPPSAAEHQCENITMRAWFPENTFKGVGNFQLHLAHTVIDPSVGECPQWCYLTKFAEADFRYPDTPGFDYTKTDGVGELAIGDSVEAKIYELIA